MKNLAKNAKRFRLDKGLTQEMLASRAGVTRGYISLLEGGKKQPALLTLSKIADVLGVGVGEFFDGDPAGPISSISGKVSSTRPSGRILSRFIPISSWLPP